MNDELTRRLVRRFPVLYQDFYSNMTETCMCWGFDHGDGWFQIIWDLSEAIDKELGYSWWQKQSFLWKKRLSRRWNKLIYKLSPVTRPKQECQGKGTHEEPFRWVVVEPAPDGDRLQTWAKRLLPNRLDDMHSNIGKLQRLGLKNLVWWPETGFKVEQVKEKFATLRYYTSGSNPAIHQLISEAERRSEVTCEVCGQPGECRTGGWWRTLCDEHDKQRG